MLSSSKALRTEPKVEARPLLPEIEVRPAAGVRTLDREDDLEVFLNRPESEVANVTEDDARAECPGEC